VPRLLIAALAATLLSTAGCLDAGPNTQTLDFFLTQPGIGDDWVVGAADYPVGSEADVAVIGDRRALPATVGDASALYQSGTNVTGDLFVFQKKYWTGLFPGATFRASLQIEFVSNVHQDCTGGIATGVVLKAGVTTTEPSVELDAQNIYRLNVDKGTGTSAGSFAQLGDIRNGLSGCPTTGNYAIETTSTVSQSVDLVTDFAGGFWMFIGTQSSVQATHEIYITRVSLQIQ
jgi:hypothetical protein